ncbi:MAG TPA: hypothetical protein VIK13_03080 [Candidatus Limnocylindrales bacterium]
MSVASVASLVSFMADAVGVAAFLGAIVLAVAGTRLRSSFIAGKKARALASVPGFVTGGIRSRLALRSACRRWIRSPEASPENWSVASELQWLSRLRDGEPDACALSWDQPELTEGLAQALLSYARVLDYSAMARIGSAALADGEVARGRAVAAVLQSDADFMAVREKTPLTVVVDLARFGTEVLAGPRWAVSDASRATSQRASFDEVRVSELGGRFGAFGPLTRLTPSWGGIEPILASRLHERARAAGGDLAARHPDSYNGVLPRLVGSRVESSAAGPFRRLHVLVERTSFVTWLVTNGSPSSAMVSPDTTSEGALRWGANHVPVSVTVISGDGYAVLPRRAANLAIYPNSLSSAANGNVEMDSRPGMPADLDASGCVDVIGAALRECREELGAGIDLEHHDLRPMALVRYTDEREVLSPVLLVRGHSGLPLEEIVRGMRLAHPVEGAFELGRQVIGLPTDPGAFAATVPWLVAEHDRGVLTTPSLLSTLVALTPNDDPAAMAHALSLPPHTGPPPDELRLLTRDD